MQWIRVVVAFALSAVAAPATSDAGRFQKGPLDATVRGNRFAVLGDGGGDRAGQRRVARALRRVHTKRPFGSVLLLGDNAHEGRSLHDAIDRPYRKLARRGVRFFPVLGNHDVSQGAGRARAQRKHFGVPRHYRVSPAPGVDAFAIDTTLFQKGSEELYGPRLEALRRRELAWLDRQLAGSRARYKIVYGHHSIYTSVRGGDPEQTAPLRERLEPILTRNRVALYLAGHYHYYERTRPIGGVTHMVSGGGGSKLVRPDRRAAHPRQVAVPEHHVVLFERVKGGLRFETVSASGEILDQGVIPTMAPAPRPAEARGTPRPRLVIMRHGESTANRAGRFAGSRNVRLTREGRAQALRAGRGLRGIRFDRAYSSKLTRASSTLRLALEAAGQSATPRVATEALDERHYGILEGRLRAAAERRFGAERLRRWRLSWGEGPPGGQSLEAVSGRAVPFLDGQVMADLAAGKSVLIASHKHTIRALIGHIEGLSPAEIEKLDVDNAEPIVFRYGRDGKLHREKPDRRRTR